MLFFFQTISSDLSVANCSRTEEQVCSDITARLASDSQLISSCSSVCCTTSKCNGKDPITTTVSTDSMVPSTTASAKGTLKRPSHGKLKLANSCWPTRVGMCERQKTVGKHVGKLCATNRTCLNPRQLFHQLFRVGKLVSDV